MGFLPWIWRLNKRWQLRLGRPYIGQKRRISYSVTINPDVMTQFETLILKGQRSQITEQLYEYFIAHPDILKPVST
jgi:hypothetical protein